MHRTPPPRVAVDRRAFLRMTTTGAAILSAGPMFLRAGPDANNRIAIGCIGVGGRGSDLMGQIMNLAAEHNAAITAVCDVWRRNLQAAAARVKDKFGQEPGAFTRYQDLLALEEVDAVVIATPDFSHGPILTAALKAGKEVYVEKPMTIDLASANLALDLARATQRVVQVGTQRRSEGQFLGAAKLVATGCLGHVSRVSAAMYFHEPRWARNVSDCQAADVDWEAFRLDLPPRPFDAKLLRQWQL